MLSHPLPLQEAARAKGLLKQGLLDQPHRTVLIIDVLVLSSGSSFLLAIGKLSR